ncbi:MAG: efflux RND transporter permease subunit [Pseudohongiella sp.]|nr:efflux RND transporter permease subunit [Pseudohongiella sp.]MDO9521991.1 efflux RND transporter permease subunit [Pseudohongiella sp.]
MSSTLSRWYSALVFDRPWLVIAFLFVLAGGFAWYAQDFKLDVSADSLLMEDDRDLEFSRVINQRYGVRDSVTIAFRPYNFDLLSEQSLSIMASIRDELLAMERIESVDSLLNVPVFGNTPLTGINEDYLTVLDEGQDPEAVRQELMTNPVFSNAIISPDGTTGAMLASFYLDTRYIELINRRTELRNKSNAEGLSAEEARELQAVSAQFDVYSSETAQLRHEDIASIRAILEPYKAEVELYLGGAPMIADDMVTFVQNDLATFSLVVLAFIIIALGMIFRQKRWVVLPLICCAFAGVIVLGILGLMDWRVTVVSSNFMSLLLIITISLTVHLMVRYRELRASRRFTDQRRVLRHTVLVMFKPCLFTALTTMVAFGSLVVSGITPIISFGWIMVMGVGTALMVVFLLFPALMSLLPAEKRVVENKNPRFSLTGALARLTDAAGAKLLWVFALIFVISAIGISRLQVENSFIAYFAEDTEIYQGMKLFDDKLGGTLSFEVLVNLPEEAEFDDFDDGFDDGFEEDSSDAYWFTADKMDQLKQMHEYLDNHPRTGKVLSFGAVVQLAEQLNNGPVDSFLWALLYTMLPETLRSTVLSPFLSVEHNQARFNVRVIESDPELNRNELIGEIREGMQSNFNLAPEQVQITGLLVMYNNVLQSLYESQILTLGVVLGVIMIMFLLLFRSMRIAIICIIPNIIAAALVLGIMGWMGIPLDIMTITIAAISVGIGVDNTIHYMHRFRREFHRLGNYKAAMYYCHGSIARAMYFTSLTIVAGFSILVLSNFIPTIVFGLLTSIAMVVALLGALTLLPQLLISFRGLGPESHPDNSVGNGASEAVL